MVFLPVERRYSCAQPFPGASRNSGLSFGGGARFHDGGQTLLVSSGWQIRWVTLWGLYDTAAHEYFFGLGVSEWDWLKNFLPGGLLNLLPK
jgi:hypothetical protein